ncbi:phosphatidylserine/phosphatidylglycerophosphate/cardiolipin synthase family protein [Permianibacter sp. IMCC34836]|uniref:phosphatidylserine/phosphatidylglycerophosphate/ cardiolipin synthase family protein n=1 Tax=Permianibacter fluminis TaxID=2738515 RepID=UPI0015538A85|nr:phosphatidylserine/phosphatidylglycerophosphate/cardiolipin synthase family protein [Permianibacter fluminis]NQD37714.1 phosphatidylserine/phosphatidylglycerophosphate/cardiolipin synthase family protein [Permianibacter fluminis]
MTETAPPSLEQAMLGTPGDFALHNSNDNRLAALRLIAQAQRHIHVFSRDLDARVFDDADVSHALSALARRHRSSHVRLLVADVGPAQRNGHRWLELVQRLSSKIDVRITHEDHLHHPFCFLVADQSGLLYRSNAAEYSGEAHFHAPLLCLEKLKFFDEVWQLSRPASELRRLFI